MRTPVAAVILGCASLAGVGTPALAQSIEAEFDRPSLDRWMYPFGDFDGRRTSASVFGAIRVPGFDDRDGQFLVGFVTRGQIPDGRDPRDYTITSAVLTARIATGDTFAYDPTFDTLDTYLDEGLDQDTGRPVEVFPVGYRNGFSLETFQEASPFGGTPEVEPAEGARNAFAAVWDDQGELIDASRHVRQAFPAVPVSIGQADLDAGARPPEDTLFTFTLDLSRPEFVEYLRESLAYGQINLMITGLHRVEFGQATSPIFATKENPFVGPATLSIDVTVGDDCAPADWNCDGSIDGGDFLAFLASFFAQEPRADLNNDGSVDGGDFLLFLSLFFG